jgi:hypothetical protein
MKSFSPPASRPAYLFRIGSQQKLLFADNGTGYTEFPAEVAAREASQWSGGLPAREARMNLQGVRALCQLFMNSAPRIGRVAYSRTLPQTSEAAGSATRIGSLTAPYLQFCARSINCSVIS